MIAPLPLRSNLDMMRDHFLRISQFTVLGAVFYAAIVSDANAQLLGLRAAADAKSTKVIVANAMLEASRRFNIPVAWLRAVMWAESAGDVGAISHKGAIGLMQLMPQTYTELQAKLGLGPDPFEPRDNILAGAAYLAEMFERYGEGGFLAAYNAGPGRYEEHLHGRPLPSETADYVARLTPKLRIGDAPLVSISLPSDTPRAPIFVAAVPPIASDKAPTLGEINDTKMSRKVAPHPLFPAPSRNRIFASEMHPLGASNARETADPLHDADLFVARAMLEMLP